MAEGEEQVQQCQEEEEDEGPKVAYKPPPEKSIDDIMKTDQGDESLTKYKAQLLGEGKVVVFEDNPNKVIMQKMSILVDGMANKEIDLTDVNNLNNMKFVVKEGVKYKLEIGFYVQREIVCGLKFYNKITRGPVKTKTAYMAGSYGPKKDMYCFCTTLEEFPSGLLGRGSYDVTSCFKDDDENVILQWTWKLDIKKDWKD